MSIEIIIAGFGGQGILFAGKVLATAAMTAGKHLSWLPSYGPEMRGGTANCHIIISDEPVASPIILKPDVLIAMNAPSFDKFEMEVKKDGLILSDSTLIMRKTERSDVKSVCVPATQMSSNLASLVMIGSLIKNATLFSVEEICESVSKCVPQAKKDRIHPNIDAILAGYSFSMDK